MKRSIAFIALLGLGTSLAIAARVRPRTLDEKVKEADLIVVGTFTALGEEKIARDSFRVVYERSLRVEVKEVLWPSSYTNTNAIVFRYYFVKSWPDSLWDFTNSVGVFFLAENKRPEQGRWDRVQGFNDWIEHETNTPMVKASIKKLKSNMGADNSANKADRPNGSPSADSP